MLTLTLSLLCAQVRLILCVSSQVSDTETRLECLLNNNKNSDFCAPLTSFDWNEVDPNLLGEKPAVGPNRKKIIDVRFV